VLLTDAAGEPLPDVAVTFTALDDGGSVSAPETLTDADGVASTDFIGAALPGPATVLADADGISVAFSLEVRHPRLGEVLAGEVEGADVASTPVVAALPDDGGPPVLVLLKGSALRIDLSGLPMAGELTGTLIDGQPAEDLTVLIASAADIIGPAPDAFPTVSQLIGASGPGGDIKDLNVVLELLVNGDPTAVAVAGYAPASSAITENVARLGDLVDADPAAVQNLPLVVVNQAAYPENTADSGHSFVTAPWATAYAPLFEEYLVPQGGWVSAPLPLIGAAALVINGELANLDNAPAAALAVTRPQQPQVGAFLPSVDLIPLPLQYLPVLEVIQNQITPILQSMGPIIIDIGALIWDIISEILDNWDVLQEIISGDVAIDDVSNIFQYLPLAGMAMNIIADLDDIAELMQQLIALGIDLINTTQDSLLPAIIDALPDDGIPFGGITDGVPSTVAGDVIPLIDAQLELAEQALGILNNLFADIDDMIPDNLNLFNFIPAIMEMTNHGIDDIMSAIDGLAPIIQDSLQLTLDLQIPIAEDLVDEIELVLQEDDTAIGDIQAVQDLITAIEMQVPPGTLVGDLEGAEFIAPILEAILPPGMGPVEDLDLIADVIPYFESQQLEDLIIPALRDAIDAAELALPDIIASLDGGFSGLLGGLPF